MEFFYDGQIRRYTTQLMRLLSNFPVQDGKGNVKPVPVMYGDLTRQVANIIRDNSENKLPSAPRISVYITGLEQDRSRTSDSTFVSKLNIRERSFNSATNSYDNTQGKNYTVERLMPTPYILKANADIWATSTEQKLQLIEQILVWFNPSLEIQTTDNFIDWTSLSVVNFEGIQWSNRSIPVGVETEIDIATLSFSMPIYINAPAKVKRLGVITNIITSLYNEATGTIESGILACETSIYDDSYIARPVGPGGSNPGTGTGGECGPGTAIRPGIPGSSVINITIQSLGINYDEYSLYIEGTKGIIIDDRGRTGAVNWFSILDALPGVYRPNISKLYISNRDDGNFTAGTFTVNPDDEREIIINWDYDSFPDDTVIEGPTGARTTIDYIIDPLNWNPTPYKVSGLRLLLLHDIGAEINQDGADAWKSTSGQDFIAKENDIVEWDGNRWHVIFDSNNATEVVYVTNLRTGTQYKFVDNEWLKTIDGEYPIGSWGINLEG